MSVMAMLHQAICHFGCAVCKWMNNVEFFAKTPVNTKRNYVHEDFAANVLEKLGRSRSRLHGRLHAVGKFASNLGDRRRRGCVRRLVSAPPRADGRQSYSACDAWGPGNSRASSGGETRTIRATYGPAHVLYIKMVARALQMWREYEQRWSLKLFFQSGALRMAGADDSYETAALPVLQQAGIRFEKLSAADCAKRWPQVNFDGVSWSVYEPDSGFLAARRGCEAVLDAFLKARRPIPARTGYPRSPSLLIA